jgi:peroxin-10
MEGPHALARGGDTNAMATQQRSSAVYIGMWMVRLHLAQYCITGKYPTWLHRLAGLAMETADATNHGHQHGSMNSKTCHCIPCRPTMHRSIGLLIGIQATVTLFRTLANRWILWVADRLEERQRVIAASSNDNKSLPTLASSSLFHSSTETEQQQQQAGVPASATTTCSICRMDRLHPAAPSSCGHVFCWSCLIQWVSTVRPECPLCRSPCRPQDIIALYDYGLPHSSDG